MKEILFLFCFLFCNSFFGQTTIYYTPLPSTEIIANPERGQYFHTQTYSSNYTSLVQSDLNNYRNVDKVTVIFRLFYLENFINTPISTNYLSNMQTDFNKIRNAGLKVIVRFAYNDGLLTQFAQDATKTRILSHIQQLQPILTSNSDIICVLQAGFIGLWGEWHFTDQEEFGLLGNISTENYLNRKEIIDALLTALPNNRMIQLRTPRYKRNMYSMDPLNQNNAFNQTSTSRIGHHNDCFVGNTFDGGTYTWDISSLPQEYNYLEQETLFVPMGGETCSGSIWVNPPRSDCPTALNEMELFHWSYSNLALNEIVNGWNSQGCIPTIINKLGYRFQLNSATLPDYGSPNGILPLTLRLNNLGFAAPFNERKAYLVLKNNSTNTIFSLQLNSDPRFWLGSDEIIINESLTLPSDIPYGNYSMYLHIPDSAVNLSTRPEYAIRFANQSIWNNTTGYNNLNKTITIGALGITNNLKQNISIYPIPAKDKLTIITDNLNQIKLSLCTMKGQELAVQKNFLNNSECEINTSNLENGIYLLRFENDYISETRKIIINN